MDRAAAMRIRLAALALCVMLAGCQGAQSALDPAGDESRRLFSLLTLMLWVCGIAYLLVLGFLAAAIWRSRRRLEPARGGEVRLGQGLAVWAGLIVVGLTVLATASFLVDRALASARDREAIEVRVTGHQWWWRIEYKTGDGSWVETANELHLPRGRVARVDLGAADVIHSFWVPNVAGKMDLIPGRRNVLDLSPHRNGWFRGQCAEFCGAQHAHMSLDVKVEEPAAFDAWLAVQAKPAAAPADPVAQRGLGVLASQACAQCHRVRGSPAAGRIGPDLTHLGSRRSLAAGTLPLTRASLQGWIAQPQALKPGANMPAVPLAPADADAVSHYLEQLR
jgi:cytochrome c oxidase subunit 2